MPIVLLVDRTRQLGAAAPDSTGAELKLLSSAIKSGGNAVVCTTLKGDITSWNSGSRELFGYTADEMLGRSFSICIPDEHTPDLPDHQIAVAAGRQVQLDTAARRKDGSTVDVHLTLTPILSAAGSITGISAAVLDIAEQRRSESIFRQIAESVGEVFWMADPAAGTIVYLSPAFEEIWGRSCAALQKWPADWIDSIHPEDQRAARMAYADQLKDSRIANEYRIVRPDGSTRHIRDRIFPISDGSGSLIRIAGIAEDVTRFRESEAALARSESRFRRLAESDVLGILTGTEDGRIVEANDKFLEILGYNRDDLSGGLVRWDMLTPPEWRDLNLKIGRSLRETGRCPAVEIEFLRKDGGRVPVLMGLTSLGPNTGTAFGFILDISRRKAAEEALRRSEEGFREFGDNVEEILWIFDIESHAVLYVSPGFERIWMRSCESLYRDSRSWMEPVHPEDRRIVEAISEHHRQGQFVDSEYRIVQPTGNVRWIHHKAFPIRSAQGQVIRMGGVAEDITERKCHEESLRHKALHDDLTDLPNRRLLVDELAKAIARQTADGGILAVFFIDLDRFKLVNDTMGHPAGDELLRKVVARLLEVTFRGSTLARVGGDEFVLVAGGFKAADKVQAFGRKLLASLDRPFSVAGQELFIGASIGVSLYPQDGEDANILQRNADTAVQEAKRNGKGQLMFFSPKFAQQAEARLAAETRLRQALNLSEFRMVFQPQFARDAVKLVGMEALIRWYPADSEPVSPASFIAIAEENGLIIPIGSWVLAESCRIAAAWQNGARRGIRVAVNVSPRQFSKADFVPIVGQTLRESGLPGSLLELEITEGIFMEDVQDAALKLRQLKEFGVTVALDDFGTGFSSLSYLRNLPIDVIKIDRSFLTRTGQERCGEALLRCVIELAHALGIRVIAEGVETAAQLELLQRLGCDGLQGFLLGRPAP